MIEPIPKRPAPSVRTRKVFYISGFDPRGVRHYYNLFREEAQKNAGIFHRSFQVGRSQKINALVTKWEVQSEINGAEIKTEWFFLHWGNVIRANWDASRLAILWKSVDFYFYLLPTIFRTGVAKICIHPVLSSLFPLLYFSLSLAASALALASISALMMWLGAHWGLIAGVVAPLFLLAQLCSWQMAEPLGIWWLQRTALFLHHWGRAGCGTDLNRRMDKMAEFIVRESRNSSVDEILLVGHSVGAILAIPVAARVQRMVLDDAGTFPAFRLLTLGQCIPYITLQKAGADLREDLRQLGEKRLWHWVDGTIFIDPLCFHLVNPVRCAGWHFPGGEYPRTLSISMFHMFPKENYAKIRWNLIRVHFQYIMSGELPTLYDYFLTTLGPWSLPEIYPPPAPERAVTRDNLPGSLD